MQRCQLCGACSWGPVGLKEAVMPVKVQVITADTVDELVNVQKLDPDPLAYLQCDVCASWALKDVIELPAFKAPDFPPPLDPVTAVGKMFEPMLFAAQNEAKPDRLERIVHSILMSSLTDGAIRHVGRNAYADWCVTLARAIEDELLDYNSTESVLLRFPDRESLVNWCERAVRRVLTVSVDHDNFENHILFVANVLADFMIEKTSL